MRQIKSKRTGRWAQKDPAAKQIAMTEGQTYDESKIPAVMMDMLVDKDFAEEVGGEVSDNDNSDVRAILQAIVDGASGKREAKDLLETWGKDKLSFDVEKRMSAEDVVNALVEEHGNQNG